MSKNRSFMQSKSFTPTTTAPTEELQAPAVSSDLQENTVTESVQTESTDAASLTQVMNAETTTEVTSFPTAVNDQITDSVTQSNVKPADGEESPAVAIPTLKLSSGTVVQPTGPVGVEASAEFKEAISQERTDKPVDTRSAWEYRIDAILNEGTNKRERYVATQMQAYLSDMAPNKPVETATGVLRQKQLWRCLKNVVSNEEGFQDAMALTIDYFREHSKGALSAIYIHRFAPDLDLSRDEARGLEQLCNIFMTAAGVVNQKDVLKHCALRTVELKGVDEIVRERLYSYFENQ